MSEKPEPTSIWYFLGTVLLVYGVVVVGAGAWQIVSPSDNATALNDLPPAIWGLAFILLAIGAVYFYYLSPWRQK